MVLTGNSMGSSEIWDKPHSCCIGNGKFPIQHSWYLSQISLLPMLLLVQMTQLMLNIYIAQISVEIDRQLKYSAFIPTLLWSALGNSSYVLIHALIHPHQTHHVIQIVYNCVKVM